jgi:hypothetical protein
VRHGCPSGKVIQSSRVEAQFVMLCLWREAQGTGKKVPKRAYECRRCGGWHLTSMTEEEYDKKNPRQSEA